MGIISRLWALFWRNFGIVLGQNGECVWGKVVDGDENGCVGLRLMGVWVWCVLGGAVSVIPFERVKMETLAMGAAVAAGGAVARATARSAQPSCVAPSAFVGKSLRVARSVAALSARARVVRVVADASKTEQLSKTSQLPEDDGKSDVQHPASKASDAKLSIKDVPVEEFKGKTVFVRADLNVPLDDNRNITDDTRIRASLPTIEYLTKAGAKVVLASHLGRPKKGPEEKFSLKPVAGAHCAVCSDCPTSRRSRENRVWLVFPWNADAKMKFL